MDRERYGNALAYYGDASFSSPQQKGHSVPDRLSKAKVQRKGMETWRFICGAPSSVAPVAFYQGS